MVQFFLLELLSNEHFEYWRFVEIVFVVCSGSLLWFEPGSCPVRGWFVPGSWLVRAWFEPGSNHNLIIEIQLITIN